MVYVILFTASQTKKDEQRYKGKRNNLGRIIKEWSFVFTALTWINS